MALFARAGFWPCYNGNKGGRCARPDIGSRQPAADMIRSNCLIGLASRTAGDEIQVSRRPAGRFPVTRPSRGSISGRPGRRANASPKISEHSDGSSSVVCFACKLMARQNKTLAGRKGCKFVQLPGGACVQSTRGYYPTRAPAAAPKAGPNSARPDRFWLCAVAMCRQDATGR